MRAATLLRERPCLNARAAAEMLLVSLDLAPEKQSLRWNSWARWARMGVKLIMRGVDAACMGNNTSSCKTLKGIGILLRRILGGVARRMRR